MKVLLGITGSVAAKLTPKIQTALLDAGHEIKTIFTASSLHFLINDRLIAGEYKDENEWSYYKKNDRVLHIDLVKWADKFVIAPCTANTLSKIEVGICDNLLTSCVRAWPIDNKAKILLVPAMNSEMWYKSHIDRQYDKLVKSGLYDWIDPVEKQLFCGDTGIGAMADVSKIIEKIA